MVEADEPTRPWRVLLVYDVDGWAWWHRARNVQRHVSPAFQVEILRESESFDHSRYDLVVVFESVVLRLMPQVPRRKLIVGSSCPRTLPDAIACIRTGGYAAGLVNNQSAWELARGCGRFYCCPNGVDEELFFPAGNRPARGLTACWVGNSRSMGNKGLDLIRRACARTGVQLLALDQADNVYAGRLYSQEALRERIYHQADFYLCASEWEGTPNPALEALACGLPVISTPVGNMPEVLTEGENGFFAERSEESLAGAIAKLQAADLARLAANARNSILAGWTWRHQASRYEAMFDDILTPGV